MRKMAVLAAGLGLVASGWAQVTERVSVGPNGVQGGLASELPYLSARTISDDGRYVAFLSPATNFVAGDTNAAWDVFLRDRLTATTERISVDSAGMQGNANSGIYGISITPDGRFVAFESPANNLVSGDTNGARDIFLRDRLNGTTERVSVGSGGTQGNADSLNPSISPDGRYVAFMSDASNLVPGDTNGVSDIFVRDRRRGTTERVNLGVAGLQANLFSDKPSISADGRYVAFMSMASNLVPGDTNAAADVFVRDRQTGTIERVSESSGGAQGDGGSAEASISRDGRYVAFSTKATNLVPPNTTGIDNVLLHDRQTGMTVGVSVDPGGKLVGGAQPSISADGRYVVFVSYNYTGTLGSGGTSGFYDIFVRDRLNGVTDRASTTTGGVLENGNSGAPSISTDGRYVAFSSYATNLVRGDTNTYGDVFIHDRNAAGFMSLCEPGVGIVGICPCSNPANGPGRGCDNSSSSGGASLAANGYAYLSIDSLVFTTNDEMPSATSLLLQGDAQIPTGLAFGQGVRCVGGTLKRLYVKAASAGSISAPDFSAGDPTVSIRSSLLGDPILPGQSRFYLVYYRDPIVLNGCPASSTFNVTQTGQVTWWP